MWRERFKPRYARMIAALRKIKPSIIIIMHSDGAVAPLIDDFIEMGIEVYNPVQPKVAGSDPTELVEKYGGRISFFGGIDQQELLPSGDLEALKAEIRRRAGILGAKGGYLMAPAHIIQSDTAPETVLAMIAAVKGCTNI
jgi:uroporphyrinogen decarboxylase